MNILYFMVPVTLMIGLSFVVLFFWANRNGQFDDLETPSHRMLVQDQDQFLEKGAIKNGKKES